MTRSIGLMGAALLATFALGACSSSRFGGSEPIRAANAAPAMTPVEAVPSAPIESAPLPPVEGQALPPLGATAPAPGTDIAALPPQVAAPAAPTAAPSRTAMVGSWTARDTSGNCKIQLSSSPSLDLYRASTSGCSNQDLSKVNAWDYRSGEIYLYQTGGAVAARLRGSSSALSGVLSKSGAPLSLSR